MRKLVLTLLAAVFLSLIVTSCKDEIDTTAEEVQAIDNEEVKDGDI
tara:strand:+ start:7597 stop:7734 length:138 start_codon:yes stop_codon:yes gene_type:complete